MDRYNDPGIPEFRQAMIAPSVLVFADSEEGVRAASRAVEASGGRLAAALPLDTSRDRLDQQAALDGIFLEISREPGPTAEPLLRWIEHVACREHVSVTVAMPPEMIDPMDAWLGHTRAELLVSPDETDRVAALSIGWAIASGHLVQDVSRTIDGVRLRRLADEVGRIARSLSSLSAQTPAPGNNYASELQSQLGDVAIGYSAEPAMLVDAPLPAADAVRKVIRTRRLRDSFFDAALFADPAWDMLLDLFAARIEGDHVAVSSLCIAAAVPPTTALRWIKMMTDHGIFERHADPNDGRRIFIRLSEKSTQAMAEYFLAARRFEGVSI
jgi:hypothetical protein